MAFFVPIVMKDVNTVWTFVCVSCT